MVHQQKLFEVFVVLSLVTSEQDRESFIELKDVLKVDIDGNVIGKEKHKRLIDAFIEDCKAGRLDALDVDFVLWHYFFHHIAD